MAASCFSAGHSFVFSSFRFLINSVIVFDTGCIKKVAEILLRRFLQRSGQKGNFWYHFDGK